jgi:hypothetical protein
MTQQAADQQNRAVVANVSLSLDGGGITLCPEVVGGGASLFREGRAYPASSWTSTDRTPTSSGAACLIYDRNRP